MFKKRKGRREKMQIALVTRIVSGILYLQRKWSVYMQQHERRWSLKQKRLYLFLFCVITVSANVYTLVHTLKVHDKKDPAIININPERYKPVTGEDFTPKLSRQDTLNILLFRKLIDSMNQTPEGAKQVTEYFNHHPGLLDSFQRLETIIQKPIN